MLAGTTTTDEDLGEHSDLSADTRWGLPPPAAALHSLKAAPCIPRSCWCLQAAAPISLHGESRIAPSYDMHSMPQALQAPVAARTCAAASRLTCTTRLRRDVATGSFLAAYKGGGCGPNGLSLLGPEYIVTAQAASPALHFWTWHKVYHTHRASL